MKQLIILIGFIILILSSSCSNEPKNEEVQSLEINLTRGEEKALKSTNNLAFKGLKYIINNPQLENNEETNFMYSPQSLTWALSLLANGSDEIVTKEILDFISEEENISLTDFNEASKKLISAIISKNGSVDIAVANAIINLNKRNIKNNFIETINHYYDADFLNGVTLQEIDAWVEDKTVGMIKDITKKINITDIALLNCIYFNGKWDNKFDKKLTAKDNFYNYDGSIANIDFMKNKQNIKYYIDEKFAYYVLDYNNKLFSMHFIVPKHFSTTDEILSELNNEKWNRILENSKYGNIIFKLPKFQLENKFNLNNYIADSGLKYIFDKEESHYNKITDDPLYFDKIQQVSKIKIDEEGSTAAAVTVITMLSAAPNGSSQYEQEFVVDKPFLFFITENSTGAILFAGHVNHME